jgi:hypothetical protein
MTELSRLPGNGYTQMGTAQMYGRLAYYTRRMLVRIIFRLRKWCQHVPPQRRITSIIVYSNTF